MQFTTLLALTLAAAGTSIAAPTAGDVNMMAAGSSWTIQNFKRVCNAADTSCTYTYSINANDGTVVPKCNYKATGSPASRASYNNVKCGAFTVSSSWSGQFGADKGFQTLAVVRGNLIAYPSYTDKQLAPEKVVKPDQSYTPQNLP